MGRSPGSLCAAVPPREHWRWGTGVQAGRAAPRVKRCARTNPSRLLRRDGSVLFAWWRALQAPLLFRVQISCKPH